MVLVTQRRGGYHGGADFRTATIRTESESLGEVWQSALTMVGRDIQRVTSRPSLSGFAELLADGQDTSSASTLQDFWKQSWIAVTKA